MINSKNFVTIEPIKAELTKEGWFKRYVTCGSICINVNFISMINKDRCFGYHIICDGKEFWVTPSDFVKIKSKLATN